MHRILDRSDKTCFQPGVNGARASYCYTWGEWDYVQLGEPVEVKMLH